MRCLAATWCHVHGAPGALQLQELSRDIVVAPYDTKRGLGTAVVSGPLGLVGVYLVGCRLVAGAVILRES